MNLGKALLFSLLSCTLLAQSDRATLTGTVSDEGGGTISGARIEVRNVETGALYGGGTSQTGNYTLSQLPTGLYELTVRMQDFKTYVQPDIVLPVAQTVRVDVTMEIGPVTESVTVTDTASQLRTESAELSYNVASERVNQLPVLPIGQGFGGMRNIYSGVNLIPGSAVSIDQHVRINGTVANTQAFRIDGQDAQSGLWTFQSWVQPSVDAIQEVAIQTSNYAAEFGQTGGAVFNATMKSGTNQFRGTAYNYLRNEALNAGTPNTSRPAPRQDEHVRNRIRQNNYGFSLGGPVSIPGIYNGRDRTFFFFNFEQFREQRTSSTDLRNTPTLLMREGDFRESLGPVPLVTRDRLGRPMFNNQVYDPLTEKVDAATGIRYRDPFPGNRIPLSQLDPVALAMQSYMPLPTRPGLFQNWDVPAYSNSRDQTIPSIKIDQNLTGRMKLSGYWGLTTVTDTNDTGNPYPITNGRIDDISTHTLRINYDYTIAPTALLHLGAGLLQTTSVEIIPEFDVRTLGLTGFSNPLMMPTIPAPNLGSFGGWSSSIGPGFQNGLQNWKPTFNASVSWVKNNHTMKFGAEAVVEGYPNFSNTYSAPLLNFDRTNVGTPSRDGLTVIGGDVGHVYASFLMGRVDGGTASVPSKTRLGKHSISWFVQDNWKVTRKLTVDYGLRWDFQTYLRENKGYQSNLGPNTPNPTADGRLGATIFEGYGGGRCNCAFAHNYPWAFGPRLGVAYQINDRTVLRAGAGISYSRTPGNNRQSYAAGGYTSFNNRQYGDEVFLLQDPFPIEVKFPNFDPGQLPFEGVPTVVQNYFDRNAGRPGRTIQWSVQLQRQIGRDLVVEAAYVANRGAWFPSTTAINDNALQNSELNKVGLDVSRASDRTLLALPLNNPIVRAAGFGGKPYTLFPETLPLRQALLPFPMYLSIQHLWGPLGTTWYDSLQAGVTKRYSRGLDISANFTWSRQLTNGAENEGPFFQSATPRVNDVFNRGLNKYLSIYDQPFLLVVSATYTTPRWDVHPIVSQVVRDWMLGAVLRYSSGTLLPVPISPGLMFALNRTTFFDRIAGEPILTQDLNCKCFDPSKELVLNKAAWADPPAGKFGTATAYYTEFRSARRPVENVSFARNFRFGEASRMNLQVRVEFTNIFNRWTWPNPTGSPLTPTSSNPQGNLTGGFGFINLANGNGSSPRQGMAVARFSF